MTKYIDRYYLNGQMYGIKFDEGWWQWDFSNWQYVQQLQSTWTRTIWVAMKPDGTKLYYIQWWDVREYNLSTPFDLSTAQSVNTLSVIGPEWMFFKPDGTKLFICWGSNWRSIYQYNLSTAWDLSTATLYWHEQILSSESGRWVSFSDDWLTVFVCDNLSNNLYSQTLSSAWDITSIQWITSIQNWWCWVDLWFGDEWKIYISQQWESSEYLTYQYLDTAYDLSSVSSSWNINIWATMALWLWFSPDWKICITSWWWDSTNYIRKYTL